MPSRPPVKATPVEIAPTRSAEQYEPAKWRTFWLIVLALATIAAIMAWQAYQSSQHFILYVAFYDVDGLRPGAEVRLSGVKVGAVKRLMFLDVPKEVDRTAPQVQVTLGIDRQSLGLGVTQLIHRDAVAVLKREGTLADRIVDILPGSAAAPPVADGDFIAGRIEGDSRTVALRSTDINQNLTAMRESLLKIQARIERGEGTLGATLKRHELNHHLAAFQTELTLLERSLKTGPGFASVDRRRLQPRLTALQNAADRLRAHLEAGPGTPGRLIADQTWRERATQLQNRYRSLTEKFSTLQRSAEHGTLGRMTRNAALRRKWQAMHDGVIALRGQLERAEGSAGKFLHDGRLRRELAEFAAELTKTVYDIRLAPFKYIRLRL